MKVTTAIKFYGSASKLARAVGVSRQAVHYWAICGHLYIPERIALKLHFLTEGKLAYDEQKYSTIKKKPKR